MLCVKVELVIKNMHMFKGFMEKELYVSHCQIRWAVSLFCGVR